MGKFTWWFFLVQKPLPNSIPQVQILYHNTICRIPETR